MNETPASRSELWRRRLQRTRARIRNAAPFVSGVLAAFVALLLFNALVPGPHQITQHEVNDSIANAIASVTPAPAWSAEVYQVIQPSLVLIESEIPGANGTVDNGLGSGVVIDDAGDILTS